MTAARDRAVDAAIEAETRAKAIADGGKRVLLVGSHELAPTMIARRVPKYLPTLSDLEATWIEADTKAAYGASYNDHVRVHGTGHRPFRAPHHTVSAAGLVGKVERRHRADCASLGYPWARPCDCERYEAYIAGECRLARFGVLYLDELPEFEEPAIRALAEELKRLGTTRPLIVASAISPERASLSQPALYHKRIERYAAILGLEVLW